MSIFLTKKDVRNWESRNYTRKLPSFLFTARRKNWLLIKILVWTFFFVIGYRKPVLIIIYTIKHKYNLSLYF